MQSPRADGRRPAGGRRRLGAGRDGVRLLRGEAEPLDELAQEVAGPLRAARVLAVRVAPVRLEREHREPVRADVDDGRRLPVAVEEVVAGDAGLLARDPLDGERAAEAARRARPGGVRPAPGREHLAQRRGGILLVVDARPAGPLELPGGSPELHHLHRLRADVEADRPLHSLLPLAAAAAPPAAPPLASSTTSNRSAAQIKSTINGVGSMGSLSVLTDAQLAAIAGLAWRHDGEVTRQQIVTGIPVGNFFRLPGLANAGNIFD